SSAIRREETRRAEWKAKWATSGAIIWCRFRGWRVWKSGTSFCSQDVAPTSSVGSRANRTRWASAARARRTWPRACAWPRADRNGGRDSHRRELGERAGRSPAAERSETRAGALVALLRDR